MRVLITGATGFVGAALCEALAAAGHEPWALSRDPESARERVPTLARAFVWIASEAPPPAEAFQGVNAVVHLAGETVAGRWTEGKKAAIRDSRILGTARLLEAIRELEQRPQAFIAASAIGYYGDRGEQELTEDAPPGGDFLADTCVAWEQASLEAEQLGLRTVLLRFGIVLEQGGGALEKMVPPAKLGLNGPLGSGSQWWAWIHRDDVVGLIRRALEDETMRGVFNATAPGIVRKKDFAKTLGKVLGRPAFLPAPEFALKTALGGFSTELLASRKATSAKALEAGHRFEYAQLEPALRAIVK